MPATPCLSPFARTFAPLPSAIARSRVSLDLGLGGADLYYRDLLVPGVGSVSFVRQLSWPVGTLWLHHHAVFAGSTRHPALVLARGIEALACKHEWALGDDQTSPRLRGNLAFKRQEEEYRFARLEDRRYYVLNTHRQMTVRALRGAGGLNLTTTGRFNDARLTPPGVELARALLDQRRAS